MLPIQVILIVGGLAGAVWLGGTAVHGLKRAEHAVVGKFHHHASARPQSRPDVGAQSTK